MRSARTPPSHIVKNPATWHWFTYAILAEMSPTELIVKVGASHDPWKRYLALLTGMPFQSLMLFVPVTTRERMFRLERTVHRALERFHSQREWFRIPVADKAEFHRTFAEHYWKIQGEELKWLIVHDDEVSALQSVHKRMWVKPKRYSPHRLQFGKRAA